VKRAAAASVSTLDEVYSQVGEFGAFQRRVVVVVAFVSFSTAFNNLGYVFWAARPDFHCLPPPDRPATEAADAYGDEVTARDNGLLLNLTVPWESTADGQFRRSRSPIFITL